MKTAERRLFQVALALWAAHAVFVIAGGRMSPRESTFEPGGLLFPLLPWVASEPGSVRLLALSALGMALEELLLLVGTWRLASRYFPSPSTRFFVSVAAVGSSLWVGPEGPSLRGLATLPLILALMHDALESGSRRPLLFAGSLVVLGSLMNPLTFAAAVPAAAALYWVGLSVLAPEPEPARPPRIRRRTLHWVAIGFTALAVVVWAILYSPRNSWSPNGSVYASLLAAEFLDARHQPLDLLLGVSIHPSTAGYCGMFTAGWAALGLALGPPRRALRLVAAGILGPAAISLLSAGVAILLKEVAPAPAFALLRLWVIFLSGLGFQAMKDRLNIDPKAHRAVALGLAALAVGLAVLSEINLVEPSALEKMRSWLSMEDGRAATMGLQRLGLGSDLPGISALMAALASGLLFLWKPGSRTAPLAQGLVLFLHPLDVWGWKFRMTWLATIPSSLHGVWHAPGAFPPAGAILTGLLCLFWIAWVIRECADRARGRVA